MLVHSSVLSFFVLSGNFTTDSFGDFDGVLYIDGMNMWGMNSMVGRGVVIHFTRDDANYDWVNHRQISTATSYVGGAGARIGQGVLGASNNMTGSPVTSTTPFGLADLPQNSVGSTGCFGLPAGSQRPAILNVVSAAVVGTTAGMAIANTPSPLFPLGFGWVNGTAFDGIANDATTKGFFDGSRLSASGYSSPLLYSPKAGSCGSTLNLDYTGSFLNSLTNTTCVPTGVISLLNHLVDEIGSVMGCSEFQQTQWQYKSAYLTSYVTSVPSDVYAFQAQYHQRMGITKAVMDAFVAQVVASLNAHSVPANEYAPLADLINTYFYAGNYSLVSNTTQVCPPNYVYEELDGVFGCGSRFASATNISIALYGNTTGNANFSCPSTYMSNLAEDAVSANVEELDTLENDCLVWVSEEGPSYKVYSADFEYVSLLTQDQMNTAVSEALSTGINAQRLTGLQFAVNVTSCDVDRKCASAVSCVGSMCPGNSASLASATIAAVVALFALLF